MGFRCAKGTGDRERRGEAGASPGSAATTGATGDFLCQGFAVAVPAAGEGRDEPRRVRGRAEEGVRVFVVLDPVRLARRNNCNDVFAVTNSLAHSSRHQSHRWRG